MTNHDPILFGAADYVVFALMLAVSLAIGIFFAIKDRKSKSTQTYLLGGRWELNHSCCGLWPKYNLKSWLIRDQTDKLDRWSFQALYSVKMPVIYYKHGMLIIRSVLDPTMSLFHFWDFYKFINLSPYQFITLSWETPSPQWNKPIRAVSRTVSYATMRQAAQRRRCEKQK